MEEKWRQTTLLLLDLAAAWDGQADAEANGRALTLLVAELSAAGVFEATLDEETGDLTVDPTTLLTAANGLVLHFAALLSSVKRSSVHGELAAAREVFGGDA